MTVAEANNLYDKIVGQILHSDLREAFVNLSYLIQQNGFGLSFDQLNELESNYRFLLKFKLKGVEDPGREKVYADIKRRALDLTDEAMHIWMSMRSPSIYYDKLRAARIESDSNPETLFAELKQVADKMLLADLINDSESRLEQLSQMVRLRERLSSQIFYKLWTSGNWSVQDLPFYTQVFEEISISDNEKSLFVSAIFLAVMQRFDEEKILLLLDLCFNTDQEVAQRALVAIVVLIYLYDDRLHLYPSISNKFSIIMDNEKMKASLFRIFYQLVRAKNTDSVTKKMQEEILPEMTKFGSAINDKLMQDFNEDKPEDFNPDWKNMMEDSSFSVKMQEFSDMQLEGIDVYMSTFSGQKFYPFFNEMSNWFLPFYTSHSSLSGLFENTKGPNVMDAVLKSGYLCSSDKYSFCFNILQIPSSYRSSMASSMNVDSEMYEEFKKSEAAMNPAFLKEQISNRYIQDLYRFFNLFSRKRDFRNVFSFPIDLHNSINLGKYLSDETSLKKIYILYLKNKNYRSALRIIDILLKINKTDSELLQKKGYCLQQLDQKQEALDAYLQADLVQSDSLWTLKRIAAMYRGLKNPLMAIEFYKKAEVMSPGDVSLAFNIGHALVEAGDYNLALEYYFKAEVLSQESLKTWRPIAWCSMLCHKFDQSAKYYQKILSSKPLIDDYLNAGHLEWCKGNPLKAIDVYKKGIKLTHTPFQDFLDIFTKDVKTLTDLGIKEEDIPFVKDELFYALEE